MTIVLGFVDEEGYIKERFLDIIHVKDTSASTLKREICTLLTYHCLSVENIRGQRYDGASNMRGEWNGLQALFLNDCPYAYYVHCMARRLQLALVAASREVIPVHQFFFKLTSIINIVGATCKRNDELQTAQAIEVAKMIVIDELETGKWANQIGTLQRAADTRWGSHFKSVCSLIRMFGATCTVLQNIIFEGSDYAQLGEADAAYDTLTSFEFVFILHLTKEIMGITDILCQALQQKTQDVSNAIHLVKSTKSLIQKLKEDGWNTLIEKVKLFCEKYDIEIPDMNSNYKAGRGRFRHQKGQITVEHYYRADVFVATIDSQLFELNNRFAEHIMELLILSSSLDPKDRYKSFDIEAICMLVEKFYPTEHEKILLRYQLQYFELDVPFHPKLQDLSSLSELCHGLIETDRSKIYYLIDRLIRLLLTLPVSTAMAFSATKIVKTRLRSKMEDEFLADSLVVYIEKEIADIVSVDAITDDFYELKSSRAQLR